MFSTITMSFEEVAATYNISLEEARISAVRVGGFCATNITQDVIDFHSKKLGEATAKKVFHSGPGPYVLVSSSFIEIAGLVEDEVAAILAHEEAHIHYEHMSTLEEGTSPENGPNILSNPEFELEADRYAAARYGRSVMRSALVKTIYAVAKAVAELEEVEDDSTKFEEIHAFMTQTLQYRLDALVA